MSPLGIALLCLAVPHQVPAQPNLPGVPTSQVVRAVFQQQHPGHSTSNAQSALVSPYQVKRQVERVAGMSARQVQVIGVPGGGLHIRLKVRTQADGQRLLDKLMQMPELAEHQVQFQVQVER